MYLLQLGTCVKEALAVDRFACGLLVVVVAPHDEYRTDAHLTSLAFRHLSAWSQLSRKPLQLQVW